jgi:outer membrane autotransporter protein
VTGSLAGITTLTNSGTIDMRGNGAAQTLSATNVTFGPNSVYALDVNGAGHSDLIAVTGTAALNGAVRVAALMGTAYNPSTVYTILTADNVSGEFKSVSTDMAFLAPRLSYATNAVVLTLLRNDVGFGSIGTTSNQNTAGTAVQALGSGNELYDAFLWLNADQAAQALGVLSGEAHSSAQGTHVENAAPIAGMLIDRMDGALDAPTGDNPRVASLDAGFVPSTPGQSAKFWAQVYGRQSNVGASNSTASSHSRSGGLAGGFDDAFGDWRLGLMLHLGRSRSEVSGLSSSANSTDYGLGAYGGRKWGNTRLSLGASYTRHDISSDRHIAFMGFADKVSADYKSGTAQAFGKLSQRFDVETVSLSPYASLAYVRSDTDGFTETGGAAALSSAGGHLDAVFTTLGLEAKQKFRIGDGIQLAARGKLGWRHIFADTPVASHRFADGADFSVSGTPIKGNAIVAGAGLDINEVSSLDVSYEGRVGAGAEGHALTGTWALRF